jgi:hypothetical protein
VKGTAVAATPSTKVTVVAVAVVGKEGTKRTANLAAVFSIRLGDNPGPAIGDCRHDGKKERANGKVCS